MEATFNLKDLKGLIRRRRKLFILIFTSVLLGMVILALALPPIYQSQAVILIENQQISDEFVKSSITSYAEQRLEMITREILKASALKQLIKEFDLYHDIRQSKGMGSAVQEMKEAIVVEPISSKVGVKSFVVAFNLSYEGKDPQKVFKVADRLSALYLQKETETREKQAAVTTRFMEAELENLRKQIEKHEKIVSDFKQKYIGELPGSASANMATLQRLDREFDRITSRIRTLQDRKIYLKGQLANVDPLNPIKTQEGKVASNPQERLKGLRLELIRLRSRLSDKHPDVRKLIHEIEELENQVGTTDAAIVKVKQLRSLRTKLSELKASKGEKHPDVVRLSKEVDAMSREVDKLLTDKSMMDVSEQKPDNPLYIDLMTQVVSADAEIKNLNEDLTKIDALRDEYQKKIENAPIVEKEYNELTLDYSNAKKRYNEVLSKLLEARVAQEMEVQQQGEHFSITDPAYLPTHPYKPNRLAIILLGFVLATGAGLGGAAFREATDHTIKNTQDIDILENIDLITTMPYTATADELRHLRFRKLAFALGSLGIVAIALVFVDILIIPLSDVFSIVFERLSY
jgi:polysaccharide biosynthesis transport protein